MGRNLMAQIAKYLSSYKRRRIGYWVLCSLGAVVVFCTTYALILPAITMSNDPICGLEAHVHDESCWTLESVAPETELVCEEWRDAAVVFHTHDALCYDSGGRLICPLEEQERHVHSDSCFVEQVELICQQAAGEPAEPAAAAPIAQPHTHTEACYSFQRGALTCGQEESQGHQHTEACYVAEPPGSSIAICPYEGGQVIDTIYGEEGVILDEIRHYHDVNTCYQPEMAHILACGLEEAEGHLHTDECYAWESVLTCPETETPAAGTWETPGPVEVHVHSEECYEITRIQVCGEEEYELHTHLPECYEQLQVDDGMGGLEIREVLTCQLPVVMEHQHSEECLYRMEGEDREVMVRTCGMTVHVHDDSCYLDLGPEPDPYFCGLVEHFHTADCYFASGELRCTMPEHTHTEECLDSGNFPDSEYPLLPDEEGQPGEDGGELPPGEDGEWAVDENGNWLLDENGERIPLNPGYPDQDEPGQDSPSLEPVQIDDTFEVPADEFVMTFHIEGIAMPVQEDGANPDVTTGWSDMDGNMRPPFQDAISGAVSPPETETATPPVRDPEVNAPAAGPADSGPADGVPVTDDTAADSPDSEEPENALDAQPAGTEDEIGYQEPDTSSRRDGRVLSMNPESLDEPLDTPSEEIAAEPEEVLPQPLPDEETAGPAPSPWTSEPGADAGQPDGQIQFELREVLDGEEYEAVRAKIDEAVAEDEDALIGEPQIMEIVATLNGQKLDLTGCRITVELKPSEELAEALESAAAISTMELLDDEIVDGDVAAGQDNPTISVSFFTQNEETQSKLIDAEEVRAGDAVVSFTFTSAQRAVYGRSASFTPNPKFDVQFYVNIDVPLNNSVGDVRYSLPFIDTSSAGNRTEGPVLPKNKATIEQKYLHLNTDGSVQFNRELRELYEPERREFNPKLEKDFNVSYLNSLRDDVRGDSHYNLAAVWVLKEGRDSSSTNEEDWIIKRGTAAELNKLLTFTNNADAAAADEEGNTILINQTQTTVIRLVYEASDNAEAFTGDATFFDYDISDGLHSTIDGVEYIDTHSAGINSKANCGSDTKLAFGNSNAGTDYGGQTGNQNNKENTSGCTFGLAEPRLVGHEIAFTVSAPDLFGNTPQTGKTRIETINSLQFKRQGDTYTLTSVPNTGASGLDNFGYQRDNWNKTKKIWSNNFWPMDSAPTWGAEGHDIKFGDTAKESQRKFIKTLNDDGTFNTDNTGTLPVSDFGNTVGGASADHNSYFGMKFAVEFQLIPGYIGPLEYYFYGDDDMWVYLDGQLICDIGGVHSSVGEYVDLWDYISKDRTSTETHRLDFFYTERGASGSTCWMQFTLPNISPVRDPDDPYNPEKAGLTVKKLVTGEPPLGIENQEYRFEVSLSGLTNTYNMLFFNEDGTEIEEKRQTITDEKYVARQEFTLKHGEYMQIIELPVGTEYMIEEKYDPDNDGFLTIIDTGGERTTSLLAKGTIGENGEDYVTVTYNNIYTYVLPSTGGPTALAYISGGALLLVAAAGSLAYKKKSTRRGAADKS